MLRTGLLGADFDVEAVPDDAVLISYCSILSSLLVKDIHVSAFMGFNAVRT